MQSTAVISDQMSYPLAAASTVTRGDNCCTEILLDYLNKMFITLVQNNVNNTDSDSAGEFTMQNVLKSQKGLEPGSGRRASGGKNSGKICQHSDFYRRSAAAVTVQLNRPVTADSYPRGMQPLHVISFTVASR